MPLFRTNILKHRSAQRDRPLFATAMVWLGPFSAHLDLSERTYESHYFSFGVGGFSVVINWPQREHKA